MWAGMDCTHNVNPNIDVEVIFSEEELETVQQNCKKSCALCHSSKAFLVDDHLFCAEVLFFSFLNDLISLKMLFFLENITL